MDRSISLEERIKKAEEVYRKRQKNISSCLQNETSKQEYSHTKKIFIKILCCIMIYFAFYFIKDIDNDFTNTIISKTNDILEYDMNIDVIYNETSKYMSNLFNEFASLEEETNNDNINEKSKEEKKLEDIVDQNMLENKDNNLDQNNIN